MRRWALIGLLLAVPAAAQHAAHDSTFGSHGMVVFGSRGQFLSHLPLYRAPHDWQMLLRVTLGGDAAAVLAADRASSGEVLYTLEPETFAHSALAAGGPLSFRGTLFRGHFERGGTPIARGVVVTVDRVIERRRLSAAAPDSAPGRQLVLRDGEETYLVHRIEGAPDFDQILEVRGAELPEWSGAVAELATEAARPHAPGEPVVLLFGEDPVPLLVVRQIYLEHGDLEAPE